MSSTIDREPTLDARKFLIAKTDQATEILKEKGIDVWITYVRESIANVDPALELIFDGDLTWESALILTADGEKIAIVGVHDAPEMEEAGIYKRVIGYREGISEPLVNTMARINPHSIAVNISENDPLADGLGAGLHRLLLRRLEGTIHEDNLVSAEDVIWSLRGRKLPVEVDAIRSAIRHTEELLDQAAADLRPGLAARDFATGIRESASMRGLPCAWTPKMCPIVSTGAASKVGHVSPGAETIGPGSLVHVDFGVRVDGYCADLQRMWYVSANGDGPAEQIAHAFDTINQAITKAAAALHPGVAGWEVDQIARDVLTEAGYEEYQHALGHQVGRAPHDGGGALLAPRWERYNETPYSKVEQGNVFTLEPSILLPDHGMIALEEMVLVTAEGCEFLSKRQMELPILHFPS
ncbi:MAG: peptidase M24 [Gemmatimonadota bacterium]|nr:MAG: peptidase M24 [Gemmatimonadota bacterium]